MRRRLLLGLLVALGLLASVELGLRLLGVEATQGWAPPRLLYIVENGKLQSTVADKDAPRFLEIEGGWRGTNPVYAGQTMRSQRFSTLPAAGIARWFVVGESAVMGQQPVRRPPLPSPPGTPRLPEPDWTAEVMQSGVLVMPEALTIPGQLRGLLGPGAEVINAGRVAQDSDDMVVEVRELLDYGPTGIAMYLGNNESLMLVQALAGEEVPEVRATRGALRRLRLYRVLANFIVPRTTRRLEQKDLPRAVWETLPSTAVVAAQWEAWGEIGVDQALIPTDSVHQALVARFRQNLQTIAQETRSRGVRLVVVPCPPDLLREPFALASDPQASAGDREEALERVARAQALVQAGELEEALEEADEAVEADPGSAQAAFLRGIVRAWSADAGGIEDLRRALALDPSRKRSSPAYNQVAAEICAQEGCVALDLYGQLLAQAEQQGVIPVWSRFFGDHEHLLPAGNRRVAELLAGAISAGDPAQGRAALPDPQGGGAGELRR